MGVCVCACEEFVVSTRECTGVSVCMCERECSHMSVRMRSMWFVSVRDEHR